MTFTPVKNTKHIRQYLQNKQKHPHNSEEYKETMTKLLQRSGSPPICGEYLISAIHRVIEPESPPRTRVENTTVDAEQFVQD